MSHAREFLSDLRHGNGWAWFVAIFGFACMAIVVVTGVWLWEGV